jgi:hypothetical protein
MACGVTLADQLRSELTAMARPNPSATPMAPPATPQHQRFDHELREHVAVARPDRKPEADLARPLGHRHQHDVHDADAADEQRHRGNPASR